MPTDTELVSRLAPQRQKKNTKALSRGLGSSLPGIPWVFDKASSPHASQRQDKIARRVPSILTIALILAQNAPWKQQISSESILPLDLCRHETAPGPKVPAHPTTRSQTETRPGTVSGRPVGRKPMPHEHRAALAHWQVCLPCPPCCSSCALPRWHVVFGPLRVALEVFKRRHVPAGGERRRTDRQDKGPKDGTSLCPSLQGKRRRHRRHALNRGNV